MPQSDQISPRADNNGEARDAFGRRLTPVIILLSMIAASVAAALFYVAISVQQETAWQFAQQHVQATLERATKQLRQSAADFDRSQLMPEHLGRWATSSTSFSLALIASDQGQVLSRSSSSGEVNEGDLSQLFSAAQGPEDAAGFSRVDAKPHLTVVRVLKTGSEYAGSAASAPPILALFLDIEALLGTSSPDAAPAGNFRLIGSARTPERLAAASGYPLHGASGDLLGVVAWDTHLSGPDLAQLLVLPLTLCLLVIIVAGSAIVVRFRRSRDQAIRWAGVIARNSEEIADREAQAQEAKRVAEVANHAKTEFLANMSHELRTPLNAVIGFSELIGDEVMGPIGTDIYKEYSRDIRASGEHLLEIINEILDLSKIEAGRMTLNEEVFSVERVIASSLRLVRERAGSSGIALTSEVQSDIPNLRGDERMIRQMLTNFLSNAVKFTPENGSVKVQAGSLSDGSIELTISDTGIGMSPDHMETAMQPFRQVSSSLARKHEGTGLGLPLAKSFIDLHGGRLDIDSELERGTTVRVTFPAARSIPTRETPEEISNLKL